MPCNTTQSLNNTSLKNMNILLNVANGMPPDQAPFCIVPLIAGAMASLTRQALQWQRPSSNRQNLALRSHFTTSFYLATNGGLNFENLATQCCAKVQPRRFGRSWAFHANRQGFPTRIVEPYWTVASAAVQIPTDKGLASG